MRAERGRRPDAAEQGAHRAVPQQVHVIDRIGPGGHPGDQARDFHLSVDPALAARPDVLRDQLAEPGALRQGHYRDQAGVRHQIRVIERYVRPRQGMQQFRVAPVRFRSQGPLRTVRASRPGTRLKQAARALFRIEAVVPGSCAGGC